MYSTLTLGKRIYLIFIIKINFGKSAQWGLKYNTDCHFAPTNDISAISVTLYLRHIKAFNLYSLLIPL